MRWKPFRSSDRKQRPGQWQETAAEAVDSDSVRKCRWRSFESVSSIQQPPRHRSDFIKGPKCSFGLRAVDCTSLLEELQVTVDLLGRGVGDPPEVEPVSSGPTVAFCEVGRYRACRANHLIGDRLQRSRNSHHEGDGVACCLEGLFMGDEVGVCEGAWSPPGRSYPFPQAGEFSSVKGATHRLDRLALDTR